MIHVSIKNLNVKELTDEIKTFFAEKNLPYEVFTIKHEDECHFIDNEAVIELINSTTLEEKRKIYDMLIVLDFKNADINNYLRHLAEDYIKGNF